MKRIIIIYINALFVVFHCAAQNLQINPIDLSESDFAVIVGLVQDDNGYIWLADFQTGLVRYDGTEIKRYPAKGESNLGPRSNRAECIATDGKNIWLGTFSSGLSMLDPETGLFTHYIHDSSDPNSIRSNQIRTLTFDRQGMLWIGTQKGLDKFDPSTKTFTHVHTTDPDEEILKDEHIRITYIDQAGVLWVGTSSPFANEATVGGLFKVEVDKNSIEHYQSGDSENTLIDSRVRSIFEDSRGTFWIGTAGDGLHTMDRKSGTFTRFLFDPYDPQKLSRSTSVDGRQAALDHITFINEDDGGNIWIGTFNGGLCMYNPASAKMTYYARELSHAHKKIEGIGFWSAHKANDGLLWVSTWSTTTDDDILHTITTKSRKLQINTLENNSSVRSFAKDTKGGFYFGGSRGVWYEDKFGDQTLIKRLEGFEGASRAGARDIVVKDNQLWIATIFGLYNIDLATKELAIYDHDPLDTTSLSTDNIESLLSLNADELLLGSQNGIQIFNVKTKQCRQLTLYDTLEAEPTIETVSDVMTDSKLRVWLTLVFNGVRQLDTQTGQMVDFPELPKGENIFWLFEDSNQKIWIGGDNGIYTLNETSQAFEKYKDKDGLVPDNSVAFAIAEDHQKQLWIGVGPGVASIDLNSGKTKFFGSSWGMNSFNLTSRGMFYSPNREMILGHTSGYYKFNTNALQAESVYTTAPFISDYLINETKVDNINQRIQKNPSQNDLLKLDHDENSFSLRLNHIDYLSSNLDHSLRYRLEGYDPNWREIDSGERLLFYNIPPGDYTFQSRVFDMNGRWQEYNMDIQIKPPWWQSWWAYLLYAIGAILIASGIYRSQKARTIRLEREKSKDRELAQAKKIEKAYTDLKATQAQLIQSEKMASLGELTAGIAHEIQNPLNFVNNFSDVSGEMIEEINEALTPESGEPDLEEAQEILIDLKGNLEKIHYHGGRASSIVRNMLDHSRASSSERVPTDINALCDEYLRLAYHGLRAKDRSFNANFETAFDESLPKTKVAAQDIGRVILNILNNAFYAVDKKAKSYALPPLSATMVSVCHKKRLKRSFNHSLRLNQQVRERA